MRLITFLFAAFLMCITPVSSQEKQKNNRLVENALGDFTFRSLGPAFMSGRIADIAIDSNNENIWYVAVGSGGVWKTTNAGTTWKPLADGQSFYSTGAITLDPNNSQIVWLGTGENVGGRLSLIHI